MNGPVPRLALILLLATHAAITAGDIAGTELSVCFERCPDDDEQGNCAASCTDCVSCPHAQASALTAATKELPIRANERMPEQVRLAHPSPEPAEILHVPKAVLA